uniref:Uncharacterized protein n=1 Tax=viral metagenome TaxID=1070528 RepID=A0A6M3X5Z6_9ZZZZ
MIVPLHTVIYDERARDGTWCMAPYPNHPKGCPNFPTCCESRSDFKEFQGYAWFAVIQEFDLKAHAERMKEKHPGWSERQARCVLYWQNSLRKRLREEAQRFAVPLTGDIILDIPEACGVNLFATMAKHGVFLKANPDQVIKIMLVGKLDRQYGGQEDV